MMVNYKIVNEQLVPVDTPLRGADPMGYVERGGDILETKTNQIVLKGLGMRKAKEMVRHLNFGGGFDGSTPAFFLAERKKVLELNDVLV
jgi:hypothetical protein